MIVYRQQLEVMDVLIAQFWDLKKKPKHTGQHQTVARSESWVHHS